MYVTSALHETLLNHATADHFTLVSLSLGLLTSRRKKKKKKKNIYIYIYIYMRSVFWFFSLFNARYVEVERDIYWDREKIKRLYLYFHPYKPVSWLLTHQGILCLSMRAPISPSQSLTPHQITSTAWATTHQPPQRTYSSASTEDCNPFHPTKHPSTKPPLHIKKRSTNADTGTLYTTNHL